MKTIATLPLLALALTACEPYATDPGYPEPYPQGPTGYPPQQYPPMPGYPPSQGYPPQYPAPAGQYRAIGTEPFWDLEIGARDMVFTDRGNNNYRVSQPTPVPINGVAGPIYRTQRLEVNITRGPCSDGMSDRTYPDNVQVYVDGRMFRGCGAPTAFFSQVGETGYPHQPGPGAPTLARTNWLVTAINGRPTPRSNFYVNFLPDQMSAKFGCNTIGSGYTQSGNVLTAGAPLATQMACRDMSFEDQGMRILLMPMTINGMGDRLTLSNSRGSIELMQAR
ncbi:META domain-containing protein [Sphingomonas xanthus]|uniref:META domain-containing protein n=1 Tax=Sphingomonas xanthus TaxID=2594473 RepID=A0A516ITM2_9SPHN|nr:META domain-containing protein [Sphingomonas xanthus]QDP20237.1 META domain-containing protein [Sphingomonas xanthus]